MQRMLCVFETEIIQYCARAKFCFRVSACDFALRKLKNIYLKDSSLQIFYRYSLHIQYEFLELALRKLN